MLTKRIAASGTRMKQVMKLLVLLGFIQFKNLFKIIIVVVVVVVGIIIMIIMIIIIIIIVLSCFYLHCLVKIVNHAYERNDSAAFWKVGEAYASHDNYKIYAYIIK